MSCRLMFCTCPDRASAEALASRLVESRLAACVNLIAGVGSIYRWQGAIERSEEVLLLIKTVAEREAAIRALLVQQHPYELPELIAVDVVSGLPAYLDWVRTETLAADAAAPSLSNNEPN